MKKNILSALCCLLFLGFATSAQTVKTPVHSCIISAKQFVDLLSANTDQREDILMPCFRKVDDGYRRDYNPNSEGIDKYDVFFFDNDVSLHTSDVNTYMKYKNALKLYGFKFDSELKSGSTSYSFSKFEMLTGSAKDGSGNIGYYIAISLK